VIGAGVRIAFLVFVTAIFQVAVFSGWELLGGFPDVLLVTVVCIALLRGATAGAVAGFVGGLLVDTATLGTLGVTSLLLAVAGHWAGRYGETTGRGRPFAPYLAVAVIAVVVGVGGYLVHFLLGDAVSARLALPPVLPSAALDVLLVWPLYRMCRSVVGVSPANERPREVELVV
jgi:rod shape-determining protein MreD